MGQSRHGRPGFRGAARDALCFCGSGLRGVTKRVAIKFGRKKQRGRRGVRVESRAGAESGTPSASAQRPPQRSGVCRKKDGRNNLHPRGGLSDETRKVQRQNFNAKRMANRTGRTAQKVLEGRRPLPRHESCLGESLGAIFWRGAHADWRHSLRSHETCRGKIRGAKGQWISRGCTAQKMRQKRRPLERHEM